MKIVIFIAVFCLLVVLGGQIYWLVTLYEEETRVVNGGSLSGRLDCGEMAEKCCVSGPQILLNYPVTEGQASGQGEAHGGRDTACGEFFQFDPVKPGRHTLYVVYQLQDSASRQFREVATVDVVSGEHQSVGTVFLSGN